MPGKYLYIGALMASGFVCTRIQVIHLSGMIVEVSQRSDTSRSWSLYMDLKYHCPEFRDPKDATAIYRRIMVANINRIF